MIAEFGVFFLIMALLVAGFQSFRFYQGECLLSAAWLQAFCVAMALAILILLRVDSDFSVTNVALHSNQALPLLYKITGAWGNHEGSMVLWVLVLSAFGLAVACDRALPTAEKNVAVAVQSALAAGALLFTLLTSNPFTRQFPPPNDGNALNPILQDIALAMHPPLLYVGYVGFSIVFSLALAALYTGMDAQRFARTTRPWILISWSALTFGIGLGSWWAYRELGWGGFWFWDPVENASLLPWLAGTALLHSNIVLEKRGQLYSWVLLLSILTFGLSLMGTFLVRSGALTSVHNFATDPARGVFILVYMAVALGGALWLYAMRANKIPASASMRPLSREGLIVFNNLFFLCACAVVFVGTSYPLFAEWLSGEKLTVGAPYFNATFIPIMALPLLLAGLAPLVPWQQGSLGALWRKTQPAVMAAVTAVVLALAWTQSRLLLAVLGMGLGTWLLFTSLQWLRSVWPTVPRHYALSVFLAHAGAAILTLGITGTGLWQVEAGGPTSVGDSVTLGGYTVIYEKQDVAVTDNYTATRATLRVKNGEKQVGILTPEYRIYTVRNSATHESSRYRVGFNDLYAVIGESDGSRSLLRLYYNPLINAVWLGCLMMVLGGCFALAHAHTRRDA